MNWTEIFFTVFGGLGLFLMGMKVMSEGMQKVAGDGLRKIINFLTSNRFMAVFVGFLVTAIIQSSSATTVMTVGFVNAGLMELTQAIGIVLGANIGTTVTGWIVSLKIVHYALPIIGLGVSFRFFARSDKWKYIGEIIFGFGILFLGMTTMEHGFSPLRHSKDFIHFFTTVDGHSYASILFGVFLGTITTMIIQSSSATIGIAIALASQGLLNFDGAVSLILGDNIGTTITAILASIGTNHHAKRAALAHMTFNVLGVSVILILFYPFVHFIEFLIPNAADFVAKDGTKPNIAEHIAMAHSVFNITNVIIFTPLIGILAKLVTKIIPEPKNQIQKSDIDFSFISYNMIDTPAFAIVESEKEMLLMAEKVRKNSVRIKDVLEEKREPEKVCDKIAKTEKQINKYKRNLTEFLIKLSMQSISEEDAVNVGNYITLAHNLEKYGDYAENIAFIYKKFKEENKVLSDVAKKSLTTIIEKIDNFYLNAMHTLKTKDFSEDFLKDSSKTKKEIKETIRKAKLDHFNRLKEHSCKEEASLSYVDILVNLDGMASQIYNIIEIATGSKFNI